MRLADIQGCSVYLEIRNFEISLGWEMNQLGSPLCPGNYARLAMGKQLGFRVDKGIRCGNTRCKDGDFKKQMCFYSVHDFQAF